MVLRHTALFSALSLIALTSLFSCTSTPSEPTGPKINEGAEYAANVSTLYSVGAVPQENREIELKWKDSNGVVTSLSNHPGKAVLVTFWSTQKALAALQITSLDSVAAEMGDSVRTIGVATDNTIHSFMTVLHYVQAKNIHSQIIVDSTQTAFHQYIQLGSDNQFFSPETFVIKADGSLVSILQGYYSKDVLLSEIRKSWK